MKLDQEKIDKIEEITLTNYESVDGVIPIESVESIIDDLLTEISSLKESLKRKKIVCEPDYDEIGKDISLGVYD